MSVYFFPLYVVAHLCISGWAIYLARVHKAPGALPVAIIATGLIYDNLIISLGASIGIGPLLQNLSLPRFAMHALLTPFLMIAASQIAAAGGIRWAQTSQWRVFIWVLVLSMVVLGIFESLVGLETVPSCFDGILRYTPNLSPAQFCYEGQEAVRRSGPPIPSIVGNVVTLVIGFFLWRHNGWVWLMVGALVMFVAAAVPFSVFGMAPGNGGEVLLLFSYVATVARFGRFRKSAAT